MIIFATASLLGRFAPAWLIWLLIFGVLEGTALYLRKTVPDVKHNGGTFSELVWWTIRGSAWYHRLAFMILLAFFIDLGLHFFAGTSLL